MPYANIGDEQLEKLEAARLSRDAILLYVEGLVHCARVLTDGAVTVRLSRISSSPDPDAAVAELSEGEFWLAIEGGWQIVDYLKHNRTAAAVDKDKALNRERQDRSRRHKSGDHSTCIQGRFCPDGAITRDQRVSNGVTNGTHSTPLHSVRKVEVEGIAASGALTRAAAAIPQGAHCFVDFELSGLCACCGQAKAAKGVHQNVPPKAEVMACTLFKGGAQFIKVTEVNPSEDYWKMVTQLGGYQIDLEGNYKSEGGDVILKRRIPLADAMTDDHFQEMVAEVISISGYLKPEFIGSDDEFAIYFHTPTLQDFARVCNQEYLIMCDAIIDKYTPAKS
jgi:hypothetical protein